MRSQTLVGSDNGCQRWVKYTPNFSSGVPFGEIREVQPAACFTRGSRPWSTESGLETYVRWYRKVQETEPASAELAPLFRRIDWEKFAPLTAQARWNATSGLGLLTPKIIPLCTLSDTFEQILPPMDLDWIEKVSETTKRAQPSASWAHIFWSS